MPYSLRLLENGSERTLENGVIRALELVPDNSQQVSCVYPKTWYTWTDRTGITNPDVTGPYQLVNLTPVPTADAGTLVITADCTTAGAIIGLAVVLWDGAATRSAFPTAPSRPRAGQRTRPALTSPRVDTA